MHAANLFGAVFYWRWVLQKQPTLEKIYKNAFFIKDA
jgi:hypothetical protein